MMKYKIIPDDIVKNIIEFLDEIQFEAAGNNDKDALHKILIEPINSLVNLYTELFKFDNVKLFFKKDALKAIV